MTSQQNWSRLRRFRIIIKRYDDGSPAITRGYNNSADRNNEVARLRAIGHTADPYDAID